MSMTSREIRQSFIAFFRERGHAVVPSAPVIPHGDPTLLFTNAGMNQFKDVFLGVGTRDYSRAVDTQKCIRMSGKHNDLEEVGHDTYHHTFFEMLGNWSFGDYYKAEAIAWAWELLTSVWKLDPKRLHVTVYAADDGSERDQETYDVWLRQPGMNPSHIHWCGPKDNFWEMGDTGPCGPCTEIHYDRTDDASGGALVNVGVPEVIEIWNNVFIQYNRRPDRSLEELPAKHVDTGMGFERICAVLQGVASNYDTDVFRPLLDRLEQISGHSYDGGLDDRTSIAMRVVADHVRTLTFAIADGATPGNTGRGYELRRVLRRAAKYAFIDLGVKDPIVHRLVGVLVETMGDVFPEIVRQREYIERVIRSEEETFGRTLERGIEELNERIDALRAASDDGSAMLGAEAAFLLYDTFGFPLDLTQLMAREQGFGVDADGFRRLMEEQRARGREARRNVIQQAVGEQIDAVTSFVGYSDTSTEATVVAVAGGGLVLDRTPFYAEMGGQLADHGELVIAGERYPVSDVQKIGAAFIHVVDAEDLEVPVGERVYAEIDRPRRAEIQRNHSATHLLHEALRRVLGSHVQQAGSLVAPGYLRFDFNHFEKMGETELSDIEAMVNAKVREGISVYSEEMPIDLARKIPNVKMFFGDKYGSLVRVVTIDPAFSVELCGGTHVVNTADIGIVKITAESSIQSGVRRIEAVTGRSADELLLERYREIDRLSRRLGVSDRELYSKVEQLLEERKQLEKELAEARVSQAAGGLDAILSSAAERDGIRLASGRVAAGDLDSLKSLGDDLRNRLKSAGIGVLGAEVDGKAMFVCVVTDDLTAQYPAGKIVGRLAKLVGGGGGGKAHLATAGGKDVAKLDEALASVAGALSD
jgi:alanyl-tRNA synthetase